MEDIMKCLILKNEEIDVEECDCIRTESYKEKKW